MAKKSLKIEENIPYDPFTADKAVLKVETTNTERVINTLRADMLPATQTMPAEDGVLKRINLKLLFGLFFSIIIIGILIYTLSGAGRPKLEKSLAGLITSQVSPQGLITAIPNAVTETPPEPSKIPLLSPTFIPTKTKAAIILPVTTIETSTPTPQSTVTPVQEETSQIASTCRDALSITLDDVGKSLCVQGTVRELIAKPSNFMVIFSSAKGSFYWVTYDMVWTKGEVDKCYQVNGTVDVMANSPILIFGYSNIPEECP